MVEIATVDELRENFDKYVKMILDGNSILMTLGNQQIGHIIPNDAGVSAIKALTGFLKSGRDIDLETAKDEYFKEKYGLAD